MSLCNAHCPCDKKINEDDYISKRGVDYCSVECANKYGNEAVTQKSFPQQPYSSEQLAVLVPS